MFGGFDPDCFSCDGTLRINGIEMITKAWVVVDLLSDLMPPLGSIRGKDIIIPETPGQRSYPRREDETVYSVRMACTGVVNVSGTPYSNPFLGLQLNLDFLRDHVILPSLPAPVAGVITLPDAYGTLTADVRITNFKLGDRAGPVIKALMEVTVPAGRFT